MGRLRIERNSDDDGFVCVLFLCFLVSTPLKHVTRSTSNATSPGEFICTVLNVRRERDIVFILHEESDRGIVDT